MTLGQAILGGLAVLGLGALVAKALQKPDEKDEPKPEGKPMSPKGQGPASPGQYRTPLSRMAVKSSGFAALASGGFVNVEPLVDTETGLYARVAEEDLQAFAKRYGGKLLTMPQIFEIWRIGYRLKPCTLPYDGMVIDGRKVGMMSIEYARKHDECVKAQLGGWDGKQPLANAGKDWVYDDNPSDHPGMARNGGWVMSEGKAIQGGGSGSEHHDKRYTDYSQLGRFWVPSLPNA